MAEPRITLKEVEHVARLARLELRPEDKERMRRELDGILAYIDKLRALDTEGVEPTSHAVPMTNVMRDDEPRPSLAADEMLANAPDPQRRVLPRAANHRRVHRGVRGVLTDLTIHDWARASGAGGATPDAGRAGVSRRASRRSTAR